MDNVETRFHTQVTLIIITSFEILYSQSIGHTSLGNSWWRALKKVATIYLRLGEGSHLLNLGYSCPEMKNRECKISWIDNM